MSAAGQPRQLIAFENKRTHFHVEVPLQHENVAPTFPRPPGVRLWESCFSCILPSSTLLSSPSYKRGNIVNLHLLYLNPSERQCFVSPYPPDSQSKQKPNPASVGSFFFFFGGLRSLSFRHTLPSVRSSAPTAKLQFYQPAWVMECEYKMWVTRKRTKWIYGFICSS